MRGSLQHSREADRHLRLLQSARELRLGLVRWTDTVSVTGRIEIGLRKAQFFLGGTPTMPRVILRLLRLPQR
jgi:hypothetical protein